MGGLLPGIHVLISNFGFRRFEFVGGPAFSTDGFVCFVGEFLVKRGTNALASNAMQWWNIIAAASAAVQTRFDRTTGQVVNAVVEDSWAERYGVKAGDVIYKVS